jgi:hypothetical protein
VALYELHLVVIGITSGEVFLEAVAARHTIRPSGKVWSVFYDTCLSPLTDARALFLQVTKFLFFL